MKLWIGELDAKGDRQMVTLSGIESELPEGSEVEAAGLGLHVFPIATDVQDVGERQSGDIFNVLFNRLAALTRGDRRAVLFPDVTNQASSGVAQFSGGVVKKIVLDPLS